AGERGRAGCREGEDDRARGDGLGRRAGRGDDGDEDGNRPGRAVPGGPGENSADVGVGGVVGADRGVELGGDGEVAVVGAQVAGRGERGVVDVVGILASVGVAVAAGAGPGRRQKLHRADGTVVGGVVVEPAVVGVGDAGEAAGPGEPWAEDRRADGAVGADLAAGRVAGLDLSDAGQQLPAQVAGGLLGCQSGRGLLVGGQYRSGNLTFAGGESD